MLHIPPQVTALGTPAEEDIGGKIDLLKEGAFKGIDMVFHGGPSIEGGRHLPALCGRTRVGVLLYSFPLLNNPAP